MYSGGLENLGVKFLVLEKSSLWHVFVFRHRRFFDNTMVSCLRKMLMI